MDYYAGAFITSLLKSAKGAPAIFDETSDSRRLQITTDLGAFNIYIKYAGNSRHARIAGRKKTSWCVNFTETDIMKLEDEFVQDNYINYIALVLSDKKMADTRIAVITYNDAMECLAKITQGGNRRINVVRYGKEHNFMCYGATESEENGFPVFVNHMRYFNNSDDGGDSEQEYFL